MLKQRVCSKDPIGADFPLIVILTKDRAGVPDVIELIASEP